MSRSRISSAVFILFAMAALLAAPAHAAHFHRKPTSGHAAKAKASHATKVHGQQTIDSERATQIQTALVREHYLTTAPTGQWDDATRAAMARYQADHGWPTRITPDSRAIIALGLGPDQHGTTAVATAAPAAATGHTGGTQIASNHSETVSSSHTLGSAIAAHSMQN
jgi:hypothetical protein